VHVIIGACYSTCMMVMSRILILRKVSYIKEQCHEISVIQFFCLSTSSRLVAGGILELFFFIRKINCIIFDSPV
jgi:hypothetical protein